MARYRIWELISDFLKNPERLRVGLEEMIHREESLGGRNRHQQVKLWQDRTLHADQKRKRYQQMAAEGLIDFEELRERLAALDEGKEVAEREVESLLRNEQRLEAMRRHKDELLKDLSEATPRLIDGLPSDKKLRIYEMLGPSITSEEDGSIEVTGDLAGLDLGNLEPTYLSPS